MQEICSSTFYIVHIVVSAMPFTIEDSRYIVKRLVVSLCRNSLSALARTSYRTKFFSLIKTANENTVKSVAFVRFQPKSKNTENKFLMKVQM